MTSQQAQEQLQKQLQALGVTVPLHSVPALPDALHAWLEGKLTTAHAARLAASTQDDTARHSDQQCTAQAGNEGSQGQECRPWLEQGPDGDAAELAEAIQAEKQLRAQLAELQHVDRAVGEQLGELQAAQSAAAAAVSREAARASMCMASIKALDAQTTQRLAALQSALQVCAGCDVGSFSLCSMCVTWLQTRRQLRQHLQATNWNLAPLRPWVGWCAPLVLSRRYLMIDQTINTASERALPYMLQQVLHYLTQSTAAISPWAVSCHTRAGGATAADVPWQCMAAGGG